MPGSRPSISARHFRPALGFHQLGPESVELAMVALAHAKITGPGPQLLVEPLVPQPHLRIQESAPRHDAPAGSGALLPIVHVVLLERARRAETAAPREPDRFPDMRWRRFICKDPRPDLGFIGPPRMPNSERPRGSAQH